MSDRFEDCLKDLRDLPVIAPPAALEARTLSAMAAAASAPPKDAVAGPARRLAKAAVWVIVAGAAVLLSIEALDDGPRDGRGAAPLGRSGVVDAAGAGGSAAVTAARVAPGIDADLVALAEESALLELMLAELPPARPVMRISTAGTIVGLEDSLALIDAELVRADTGTPEYRVALMRDRVEVMNALVNVRYAQSRAFTY